MRRRNEAAQPAGVILHGLALPHGRAARCPHSRHRHDAASPFAAIFTMPHLIDDNWDDYQSVLRARDEPAIESLVARFTRKLGFSNYAVAMRRTNSGHNRGQGSVSCFHNLQGELARPYSSLDSPEAERSEPRIQQAKLWLPSVAWNSLGKSSYDLPPSMRASARKKLMLTGEFGLHSGITVPIRAPGLDWSVITFSASLRTPPKELVPLLLNATYFASCLQTAFWRMQDNDGTAETPLSDRERECLRRSALGKTSWEISLIEHISERTVNFHLYRAASKLGVRGRRAAVAQALARGLIRL